jgi:hypothetical protein
MIRRLAPGRHSGRKSFGKRQDFFRSGRAATLPVFRFETLFERRDDSSREAFARKMREFGSERICSRVLEIEALQNSTSYW